MQPTGPVLWLWQDCTQVVIKKRKISVKDCLGKQQGIWTEMSLLNLPIFCHDTVFSLGAIQLKWEFLQLGPNGTESIIRQWVSGRLEGWAATMSGWSEPGSLQAFVCVFSWLDTCLAWVLCFTLLCLLASQFWRVLLLWSWLSGCEECWLNSSKLIFTVKTDCCQRSFKSKNIICTPFLYIQGTPLRIWVPNMSVFILSLVHGRRPFTFQLSFSGFIFLGPSVSGGTVPVDSVYLCSVYSCDNLWQALAALWEGLVSVQVLCAILGGWLPGAHLTASFQHWFGSAWAGKSWHISKLCSFFQTSFNNLVLFPCKQCF